jgi:hypothetical protein
MPEEHTISVAKIPYGLHVTKKAGSSSNTNALYLVRILAGTPAVYTEAPAVYTQVSHAFSWSLETNAEVIS